MDRALPMTIRDANNPPLTAAPRAGALWFNRRFRSWIPQAVLLLAVVGVIAFFAYNASQNIGGQKLSFGFDFLSREAGFGIGETLIAYSSQSSFARAFLTGLVNTIYVSAIALVLATVIGFIVGIGSLSMNPALRRVCLTYVAIFRNIPLLLQLYLWYSITTSLVPTPAAAWGAFGVQISRVGVYLPMLHFQPTAPSLVAGLVAAALVGIAIWHFLFDRRAGVLGYVAILAIALLAGSMAVAATGGATVELPVWQKFRFNGGIKFSPEFCALLVGLSIYSGSFIAEIVRAGILAVKKGQKEAAQALGLSPGQTMRYVVIPQASRVIIPPLTSQYLNLVKNSSLGVAIGYPDLVSVGNTTLNITGRAIECVAIMMAVYLALSLTISALMNVYNKKMALRAR